MDDICFVCTKDVALIDSIMLVENQNDIYIYTYINEWKVFVFLSYRSVAAALRGEKYKKSVSGTRKNARIKHVFA